VWCWWKEKLEYAFKKLGRTMFIKPFYFQLHTAKKIISKHRNYYPRLCMSTRNRFYHLYGHSKICISTGHRLVCRISGACLMAIYKGTFCWQCKMAGKVMRRAKRGEGHSITFCIVFYLALPCRLLAPHSWTDCPDLSICPIRPVLSHV